mmetsp:Transcript_76242/g.247312  ORF Transcript_76242/g.247312 Transcript_76242/m.247312 type:complete len:385 (+) Transcript_76242:1085-2239(+)
MLCAGSALLAIEPVHVRGIPIAGHEGHAPLKRTVLPHCIQLVARAHGHNDHFGALSHGGCDDQVGVHQLELLREDVWLRAVNVVHSSLAELILMGLVLRVAPLVARPVGVAGVVIRAGVIGDLLDIGVPFVHVELGAAAHIWEALRITVVVPILAGAGHRHVHQVEVEVASTGSAIHVHVHRERLANQQRLVKLGGVAVVGRRLPHEVESVGRPVLHVGVVVDDGGAGQVIGIDDAVLVDLDHAILPCAAEQTVSAARVRHGVLDEGLLARGPVHGGSVRGRLLRFVVHEGGVVLLGHRVKAHHLRHLCERGRRARRMRHAEGHERSGGENARHKGCRAEDMAPRLLLMFSFSLGDQLLLVSYKLMALRSHGCKIGARRQQASR